MKAIYLTAIAILLGSFHLFSQGTGITHYQRRAIGITLQFPSERYSSEGFIIAVPDSIYSFGKITVKKAKFEAFNAKSYMIRFEDNLVSNVEFKLSGKSDVASLIEILNNRFEGDLEKTEYGYSLDLKDGRVMKCSIFKFGRKALIKMQID